MGASEKDEVPRNPPEPGTDPSPPKKPEKTVKTNGSYIFHNIYHWGWFNGD